MRRPEPAGINRTPQALPVPLGGMLPVHSAAGTPTWTRARVRARLTGICGIAMGLAGIVLVGARPGTAVYAQDGVLHVGATALHLLSESDVRAEFAGDATYVLRETPDGVDVEASWTQSGVTESTECVEPDPSDPSTVACHMTSGAASLSWIDRFNAAAGEWHRRYGDGRETDIAVPAGGAAFPVAFPIDH